MGQIRVLNRVGELASVLPFSCWFPTQIKGITYFTEHSFWYFSLSLDAYPAQNCSPQLSHSIPFYYNFVVFEKSRKLCTAVFLLQWFSGWKKENWASRLSREFQTSLSPATFSSSSQFEAQPFLNLNIVILFPELLMFTWQHWKEGRRGVWQSW